MNSCFKSNSTNNNGGSVEPNGGGTSKNGRNSTVSLRSGSSTHGVPSFDQVLQGEIPGEPWLPDTFLEFLHTELNDENFFFYEEIEAFKAAKGKSKKAPPESLLILPSNVRESDQKYVHELVNTFVKENAPRQVNISSEQRTRLLEDVANAVESNGYQPEMFEDAQLEVKRLMQMDSWPRFMKKVLTENVSQADANYRLKMGIFWSFVNLLIVAAFLGFLVPRWYMFLLLPLIFYSVQHLLTWKTSLCFRNAMLGLKDREGSVTARVPLACPIAKMNQKHRAKKLIFICLLLSSVFTGAAFSLTYIIEAGQGRLLYG